VTKGIPKKQQRAERRRERAQAATGLAQGAKKPVRAVVEGADGSETGASEPP
jgi:hypothetical protein